MRCPSCLHKYVDWHFVWSILSPQELLRDFDSPRKLRFLATYAALALTVVIVWNTFDVGRRMLDELRQNPNFYAIAVTLTVYSAESFILVIEALVAPHPGPDRIKGRDDIPEDTKSIAIIIPCHQSADVVMRTVRSCMKHVRPDQIFVVDNGNYSNPPDESREKLENADLHQVNYIFNPYGNKTLALYAGCIAAKNFTHVLLMDDDTSIPEDMNFGLDLFSSRVKAVCYPIRAIHPQGASQSTLFIQWQDIEYKASDFAKHLQDTFCSVLFPHGAVSLWDRTVAIQCLREHDTVFYADDVKMGMYLQRTNRYEMKLHPITMVNTDAPTSLVGPYPNYYNQRVRSWDMSEYVYGYKFFGLLCATHHRTVMGTLVQKGFQLYSCFTLVADTVRLPVIAITFAASPMFFLYVWTCCFVLQTILNILWDRLAFRQVPHRRSKLWPLLTYQLYRYLLLVVRFLGMIRAFTVYLPNYKRKPTIPEIEAEVLRSKNPGSITTRTGRNNNKLRVPVWMDQSHPLFDHYDPKDPTGTETITSKATTSSWTRSSSDASTTQNNKNNPIGDSVTETCGVFSSVESAAAPPLFDESTASTESWGNRPISPEDHDPV